MRRRPDAAYYTRLEAGAVYLAEKAVDPAERAEHLKMAGLYRRRARDAVGAEATAAGATVH